MLFVPTTASAISNVAFPLLINTVNSSPLLTLMVKLPVASPALMTTVAVSLAFIGSMSSIVIVGSNLSTANVVELSALP